MELCYRTTIDAAGRVYVPKDILTATKLKVGDVLYVKADAETGSVVIATEEYFKCATAKS